MKFRTVALAAGLTGTVSLAGLSPVAASVALPHLDTTCRASVARVRIIEPVVANIATTPCTTEYVKLLEPATLNGVTLSAGRAQTSYGVTQPLASAHAAQVHVTLPGLDLLAKWCRPR